MIANPRGFRSTSIAVLSVLALVGCDTVATVRFMFANDRTEARWESEVPFIDAAEEAYMGGVIGYDLLRRYLACPDA